MMDLVERLVPDELWVLFRRVVPPTEVKRPQGGGRRRAGDREVLASVIFVATSGCTWRQLPPVFGPAWQTVYRRFAQWSADRVWARLHRVVLDELGARGELDWSRCAIDSVSVRAAKGGSAYAPASPADASSPPPGSAATAGSSNELPGWPAADACTAATNASPDTSSPSLA